MSGMLLFSPLAIRGVELRNRIVVPLMHWLGTRAKHGFGTQPSTWQNGLNETRKVL
jgi:2,4-dienoyl-CoA reductase-like NADH-dependent reductase (Old Yellow Enzyme family)